MRRWSRFSRGGVIEDITWRDLQLNDVRQAVAFEWAWRMVPPIAPPAKVPTVVRHIRLINFPGAARSGGVLSGRDGSPLLDVQFKKCNLTARRGLLLHHVKVPDLSGLHLQVADGPPIRHGDPATSMDEQP